MLYLGKYMSRVVSLGTYVMPVFTSSSGTLGSDASNSSSSSGVSNLYSEKYTNNLKVLTKNQTKFTLSSLAFTI